MNLLWPEQHHSNERAGLRNVSLYHGDFLLGFVVKDSKEFDEWQFLQREDLQWADTLTLNLIPLFVEIVGENPLVMGRIFRKRVMGAEINDGEELDQILRELEDRDVIYQERRQDECT